MPTQRHVVVTYTGAVLQLTDTPAPGTVLQVFRNGILMVPGGDYEFSAVTRIVAFRPVQELASGDVISFVYWVGP